MPAPLSVFAQPNEPKLFASWPGGVGAPNVPIPLSGGRRRRGRGRSSRRAHRKARHMRRATLRTRK